MSQERRGATTTRSKTTKTRKKQPKQQIISILCCAVFAVVVLKNLITELQTGLLVTSSDGGDDSTNTQSSYYSFYSPIPLSLPWSSSTSSTSSTTATSGAGATTTTISSSSTWLLSNKTNKSRNHRVVQHHPRVVSLLQGEDELVVVVVEQEHGHEQQDDNNDESNNEDVVGKDDTDIGTNIGTDIRTDIRTDADTSSSSFDGSELLSYYNLRHKGRRWNYLEEEDCALQVKQTRTTTKEDISKTYNSMMSYYETVFWRELPQWVTQSLEILGWNKELWDANDDTTTNTNTKTPASETKDWHDLSKLEQDAVRALGYTPALWGSKGRDGGADSSINDGSGSRGDVVSAVPAPAPAGTTSTTTATNDNTSAMEVVNTKNCSSPTSSSSSSPHQCRFEKWQTTFYPTCNDAHTLPFLELIVGGANMVEKMFEVMGSNTTTTGTRREKDVEKRYGELSFWKQVLGRRGASSSQQQQQKQLNGMSGLPYVLPHGGRRMGSILHLAKPVGEVGEVEDVPDDDDDRNEDPSLFVYKTLRYEQEYEKEMYEVSQIEAIVHGHYPETTVNMYGFCGVFSLTELGEKSVLRALENPRPIAEVEPVQRLELAMNLSRSISTMHNLQSSPTLYRDFDPANSIMLRGQIKLIDFHQALLLPRNRKTGQLCYPKLGPPRQIDSIAPEILIEGQSTEKSDVYGLGSILFYILTGGARMYHCESPKGICNTYRKNENTIPDEAIAALKLGGILPTLPATIETSNDLATRVLRETMKLAVQTDPRRRPTAQGIVNEFEKAWDVIQNKTFCDIPRAEFKRVVEPVYVTSYPGSGSEMSLNIIEALSGTRTVSHGGKCDPPPSPYDYVALKVHYPWHCKHNWTDGLLANAIVLLRNPVSSFPSKANRNYEAENGVRGHSKQCPEEYWVQWREKFFERHLRLWEELVHYWYDHYEENNRMIIFYESLVTEDEGPTLTLQIARFLKEKAYPEVDATVANSDCVWQKVVAGDKSKRRGSTHRKKSYQPMFTPDQYDSILEVIVRLQERYREESFYPNLVQYERTIFEHKAKALGRTVPTEDVNDGPPKIAWLMSYPNSYNTKIRTLLQDTTQTTGATNYGSERIHKNGEHTFSSDSIPVYPHGGGANGPYIISEDLPLPAGGGYVLVKTHCGVNGCRDCNVAPTVKQFMDDCTTGTQVDGNGKHNKVQYNASIVERAVHLYLDPFSNVLTRFNSNKNSKYPKSREGFLNWCHDYDDLYVKTSKSPYIIPEDVLKNNNDVLCHTEFYKYIQWHNHAIQVIRDRNLPYHTIFAEDFSNTTISGKTLDNLLEFLKLNQVNVGKPFGGIMTKLEYSSSYFTSTEIETILSFLKRYATEEVWTEISSKYFSGYRVWA